jgi:NADH-quinone oxidoreductase subunit N
LNYGDLSSTGFFLWLSLSPVIVMLGIAARRNHTLSAWLTIGIMVVTMVWGALAMSADPVAVTQLLVLDRFGLYFIELMALATLGVIFMARCCMGAREGHPEEFYVLLLLAFGGGALMASSTHFASFFVSLEVMSISLYALIGYVRKDRRGLEASVKYLVLAAAAAAFLLFGMALIYAEIGGMAFADFQESAPRHYNMRVLYLGVALLIVGAGFKLSLVPFQFWTPDVYEGAPAPVTAFLATVSKFAVVAVLLRLIGPMDLLSHPGVASLLALVAAASMIAGNLLALGQRNVKRMLAYSSVSHMGYLLVAFLAGGEHGAAAALFYLAAYAAATVGAFGVVTFLGDPTAAAAEADTVEHYEGLFHRRPAVAAVFSTILLSLAGIPLTAGFLGKLFLMAAGARAGLWWLLVVLALTSAVGLVYYIGLIVTMCRRPSGEHAEGAPASPALALSSRIVLGASVLAILWLGLLPSGLIGWISTVTH